MASKIYRLEHFWHETECFKSMPPSPHTALLQKHPPRSCPALPGTTSTRYVGSFHLSLANSRLLGSPWQWNTWGPPAANQKRFRLKRGWAHFPSPLDPPALKQEVKKMWARRANHHPKPVCWDTELEAARLFCGNHPVYLLLAVKRKMWLSSLCSQ